MEICERIAFVVLRPYVYSLQVAMTQGMDAPRNVIPKFYGPSKGVLTALRNALLSRTHGVAFPDLKPKLSQLPTAVTKLGLPPINNECGAAGI